MVSAVLRTGRWTTILAAGSRWPAFLGGATSVVAYLASRGRRARRPAAATWRPVEVTPGHRGGSGTPLLLLHGVGGTWRVWVPVLAELQRAHEVFAPTLPGHSGAEPLADGVLPSIAALTDGVVDALDRAGLDRVHVVGNSLGGWIALELARRGRARSVVVFGPAGAWRSELRLKALAAQLRSGFAVLARLSRYADTLAARSWARTALLGAQMAYPDRVDPAELAALIRAARHSPVVSPLLRTLVETPLLPLADPGYPIRVVWAERDRVIPFEYYGRPLLERIPSAELVRLGGIGHVPMSDAPAEVARLVLEVTSAVDGTARARGGADDDEQR
jgi:pimeloyl-ACP methyl ester carboxylesterase